MEPTKKPKVKYFMRSDKMETEQMINEFLSQNDSIVAKSIAIDENRVMLLYEE